MGPPELPGETGTDIWIHARPSYIRRAETSPSVSVCSRPSGLPIEIARSPTTTASESPSERGAEVSGAPPSAGLWASMRSRARSTWGESTSTSADR